MCAGREGHHHSRQQRDSEDLPEHDLLPHAAYRSVAAANKTHRRRWAGMTGQAQKQCPAAWPRGAQRNAGRAAALRHDPADFVGTGCAKSRGGRTQRRPRRDVWRTATCRVVIIAGLPRSCAAAWTWHPARRAAARLQGGSIPAKTLDAHPARRGTTWPLLGKIIECSICPAAAGTVLLAHTRRPRHGRARDRRPDRPVRHRHAIARAQQAQHDAQPEERRGTRDPPAPGRRVRRAARGLPARRDGAARHRLRDARGAQSATRLLLDHRLRPGRSVRRRGRTRRQLSRLRRRAELHRRAGSAAGHPRRADRRHRRRLADGGDRDLDGAAGARRDRTRPVDRHRHARRRGRVERLPHAALPGRRGPGPVAAPGR